MLRSVFRHFDFLTQILIIIAVLFIYWWLYKLWKRRKLYIASYKLPGPLALPLIGSLHICYGMKTTEDIFKRVLHYFNKYDSTFRVWFGPNLAIAISKPEDLEIIYNNPNCFEKDLLIMKGMRAALGNGLITAPVSIWKPHRKLINPTFNPKILNGFLDVYVKNANQLVDAFRPHVGKGEFNMFPYVFQTTISFICESALGIDMNTIKDVQVSLSKYLDETMAMCFQRMAKPWLYPDFVFFNMSNYGTRFKKNLKYLSAVTEKVIERKRKEMKNKQENDLELNDEDVKSKRKNFLDLLMELNENGVGFTDKELRDQINTFVSGGSDTSAIEVSFACMFLGANPHCQEKAYAEIQEIFGDSDRDITVEDISQMKYLERVLKETLRLFPPLPVLVRYLKKDVKLDTVIAPAGSTLIFTNYIAHRDPKTWKNPLIFDPDRFLPEEAAKRHPYSYVPFGGGPRNCIGYRYAMISMKILLCSLLRSYKFTSNFNVETARVTVEVIMKAVEGHPVQIELRK